MSHRSETPPNQKGLGIRPAAVLAWMLALAIGEWPATGLGQTGPGEDIEGPAEFREVLQGSDQASIPLQAMPNAIHRVRQLRRAVVQRPIAASIGKLGWEWLGPGNVGGRTRSLLIHPYQPNIMWLGGASGGIWKTWDNGLTWSPLNDFMASLVISCMVLDPRNPDRIYVGTGEGFRSGGFFQGFGIFLSENGGVTWDQLPSTANDDFRYVNRLAFSSEKDDGADRLVAGEILLAATRKGLFRSTDRGKTFTPPHAPVKDIELLDVEFDPLSSAHCLASGRNGRAFYSIDGGVSWSACQGLEATTGPNDGRVELTYARAMPGDVVVYAAEDVDKGRVYRSVDGGKTFTLRSSPHQFGYPQYSKSASIGWFANTLWAGDPSDPNLVIIGGVDLYRSVNGGRTFTSISDWNQSSKLTTPHADHHAIVSHPDYNEESNRKVFFCNDGGLYRADDVRAVTQSSGWTMMNNGLGISQFYGAAGNPNTEEIVAGAQDNGTFLYTPVTGPNGYKRISDGDGGQVAADPVDRIFYLTANHLLLRRYKIGGSKEDIYCGIADAGNPKKALMVAPVTLDPNRSERLYVGGVSLWVTEDAKAQKPVWSERRKPIGPKISAIAVAPDDPQDLWIGYGVDKTRAQDSGAVFRCRKALDKGLGHADDFVRVNARLPRRHCTRLVIDPKNHERAFALFNGYEPDNLWVTVDGGQKWTPLGSVTKDQVPPLPSVPDYDLLIHPSDSSVLVLGNEVGLFISDNQGATWSPIDRGPTNCAVFKLFMLKRYLVVVTHGRGIFRTNLDAQPPVPRVIKPIAP